MPRMVHFIIADSAFKKKFLVYFLRALPLIRTKRPQDEARVGVGEIVSVKGSYLMGVGTKFTKSVKVKDAIFIKTMKTKFFIVKILDDERLGIKNSGEYFFENGGEPYAVHPKLDQKQVFDESWKVLGQKKVIGIFPEGGSHDQSGLLPLKAGACILSIGAEINYNVEVKVMAVGLNYYAPHKFRSTVVVEFGVPFWVTKQDIKKYQQPETKREVISTFLKRLTKNLYDVKHSAEDYEQLMAIYMARNLLLESHRTDSDEEHVKLFRLLASCFDKGKNNSDALGLLNELAEYRKTLKNSGIKDWQVVHVDNSFFENSKKFLISFAFIIITLTIAFPAIIYTLPIRVFLVWIAEYNRKKALAKSTVKIKGNDVVASFKIFYGFPVAVVFGIATSLLYYIFFSHWLVSSVFLRCCSVPLFSLIFNFYVILMIQYHNGLNSHLKICLIRFFIILYRRRVIDLIETRKHLKQSLEDFVEKYDKLFMKEYSDKLRLMKKKSQTNLFIDTEEAFSVLEDIVMD